MPLPPNILYLVIVCHLNIPVWWVKPSERLLKAHLGEPREGISVFYSDNSVDNDDISSYLLLENYRQGKPYAKIIDEHASL